MDKQKLCKECRKKGVVLNQKHPARPELRRLEKPNKCANPDCDNSVYEEE